MDLKSTHYAVESGIATITLSRPHRGNAWTGRMHTEYRWLLDQAEKDLAVRAILVTGSGRAFCVGGDSAALEGHVKKGGYDPGTPEVLATPGFGVAAEFDAVFACHFGLSKPVIGAINGPAAGVGLALACFCDIRFAVPNAKLTTAHGKLNLPAEYGLSWLLPRMIGLPRATEILLSSRIFTTDEAHSLGLIHQLVPAERLLDTTRAYVQRMLESVSPNSLKQTRWQIYRDLHRDVASAVTESEQLIRTMMKEPDYGEGVSAFIEKRLPRWGDNSSD
jgi:enoyl-CoA hydratase/carnithine racemase